MAVPIIREKALRDIQESIKNTENHIYRLKIEFASLLLDGATAERLAVLQQLYILQANLKLLKVRLMYALEMGN